MNTRDVILARLSEREFQVFARLAHGERMASIAAELGLKHSTVTSYRDRILSKLGLHTVAELAVVAYRAHIVAPPKVRK